MKNEGINEWDSAAKAYAEFSAASPYALSCKKFITQYYNNLNKISLLDLGCGHGEYTELFRLKGASVVGCDASSAMLEIANSRYPHCKFEQVNLLKNLPYKNEQFDLVFCSLVLMDINPLEPLIAEIKRILVPGGQFFFNIVHPAFYPAKWMKNEEGRIISKNISVYLTPFAEKQDFWLGTTHYHRPLSYYFNLMANNGLYLYKIFEPKTYEDSKIPDIPLYLYADYRRYPL